MASLPLIGITTYPRNAEGAFHLPADYVTAVRRSGAIPWLMAPGEPRPAELLARLDGLILSGGGDVDPALYGGGDVPLLYEVDRERDECEIELVRAAASRGLPTLAICRGCQLANVALGGTLIGDLQSEDGAELAHRGDGPHTSVTHAVEVEPGSRLARVMGTTRASVRSSHHQAVRRLADGLRRCADAPDGVLEAFEVAGHPFFLAVQWHPEESAGSDAIQQRLFDGLAQAASAGGAS